MARKYLSVNPYTGALMKEFAFSTTDEVFSAIHRSSVAFKSFSQQRFDYRAIKLRKLAEVLTSNKSELSTLMTEEMGKPISQSLGEINKSIECCNYYASHGENLLKPEQIPIASECYIKYEPIGPIFSIMPFNFPTWMPLKTSIPHLMAGNTIILKHAENTPQTADLLEKLTTEAGLVDEFINIRPHLSDIETIIRDPRIQGVSLTGSVSAGKKVASIAASAMKKFVMELGGNDAFIVLKDADLPKAAKALVMGRLAGCGQVCISPKRALVVSEVYPEFIKLVEEEIKAFQITDPLDPKCLFGPMARIDLVSQVYEQVKNSVAAGARLVVGGKPVGDFFMPATLLVDVQENMQVFKEEVFGPVVCVARVKDEAEAIQISNRSEFGLSAVVFSKDVERVKFEVFPKIQAGMVFLNEVSKSIVQVPFGGFKGSGVGRELGSIGIKEFCNAKTVYIS
jgi:acyl-CoA reductase-like NAD-dependent aldehyde dehydrogenase